jgi:cell volume regulation protein A
MEDTVVFAVMIGVVALGVLLAVLSNRISGRIGVPAPALFLVGAAAFAAVFPALGGLSIQNLQRIVTVALIVILFDGGMHIGWRRFRGAAGPIVWLGVAGTAVTAAALALAAHLLFGLGWPTALLLGTALSPTDPAVVFSVLGQREVAGRTGVLLEGESGANDPVGIALMASLLTAGGLASGLIEFTLQMVVGGAVGVLGARVLLWAMRRVALPSEGLYAIRTLAGAALIYAVATVAHGSGFLAVLVAGILVGDERAPYKLEIERFHAALASLGEIVAFTVLGLSVQLAVLRDTNALALGLALGALLAFVVRPVFVGLVSLPIRLRPGERGFVLWAGLKGAVPLLLGSYAISAGVADNLTIYHAVVVAVVFSVVVQGGLVPFVADRFGVTMRTVEPEPWALGVSFREEPRGLRRYVVAAGSPADGARIEDLPLGEALWISFISREGELVQVRRETELRSGDEVLAIVEHDPDEDPAALFTAPSPPPSA